MNTVYLTCDKQHISKLGLTANFETASGSNWETTKILLPFLIQSVLSSRRELPRCCSPVLCCCLQKCVTDRTLESGTSAPRPGEKSCVTANLLDIQLLLVPDLQGWLMFPNKFKASLFFVP